MHQGCAIYSATTENQPIASELLAAGKVIILPTDTLYALAADITNAAAVDMVYQIKKRSHSKFLPMLAADSEMVNQYTNPSQQEQKMQHQFWPGAVTIILPTKPGVSLAVNSYNGYEIAARVPDCDFVRGVVSLLGRPITGTSANISNQLNTLSLHQLQEDFAGQVAAIFQADWKLTGLPSKLIKLTEQYLQVLR